MSMPRAKKSYGQNWLVDETVVKKIINASEIEKGEAVLEIGPGTGVLTQALVDAGAVVTAIEADHELIAPLEEKFGDMIDFIEGDALQVAPMTTPYKLVANIPYNITSDVLKHFLTIEHRPSRMILMVQREVADRIVAIPPNMSLLSVVCQLYAQCSKVSNVPAGAFRPVPKVDSAIVRLDIHGEYEPENVIALAKVGFASRRKQLHKNLSSLSKVSSEQVKISLDQMGLDPRVRAQELSPQNWIELTHKLAKKRLG